MYLIFLLAYAVLNNNANAFRLLSTAEQTNVDTKIVGGEQVTNRSAFAYQVSLRYSGSHMCGASIVSKTYILTAAHCCFESDNSQIDPKWLTAVVGTLYLSSTGSVKQVRNIYVHESYISETLENDVAVMKVDEFDSWSDDVQPVIMATVTPAEGIDCIVSGWGSLLSGGSVSQSLQSVVVQAISAETCNRSYGGAIYAGMVCAGADGGGKDSCQGDSGGPMVCNGTLSGIVSWGYGCASALYPGVYTDVASYRNWIDAKVSAATTFTYIGWLVLSSLSVIVVS